MQFAELPPPLDAYTRSLYQLVGQKSTAQLSEELSLVRIAEKRRAVSADKIFYACVALAILASAAGIVLSIFPLMFTGLAGFLPAPFLLLRAFVIGQEAEAEIEYYEDALGLREWLDQPPAAESK